MIPLVQIAKLAPPTPLSFETTFARLKEAVLARRPVFREILLQHGAKSLFQYIADYTATELSAPRADRQDELIAVFKDEVARRLGPEVAASAGAQLKRYYYASTTDHYGPISHPWVLNFNLVTQAAYMENPDPDLRNIITLACANVSLNNFSFPRGLSFTGMDRERRLKTHRLSFLPSNAHSHAVYNFRPYTGSEIHKVIKLLTSKVRDGAMQPTQAEKLAQLLEEIYCRPDVLGLPSYAEQITKTSYELWKKLSAPGQAKDVNFVYIDQEWLVSRLLMEHHLSQDTFLNRLIFDPSSEARLIKHFESLPESFMRMTRRGTYLFWLQRAGELRTGLWKEGNALVSEDGTVRIELTPEAIRSGLESKELIPSVLLTFITLCFYYGLKCLGGLGQVNYLPRLKEAFIRMCMEENDVESALACSSVYTKDLGGEVTVAFLDGPFGQFVPATTMDLLVHGVPDLWSRIAEESKRITLSEALSPMIPEDYPVVYPKAERESELAAIKPADVVCMTGLNRKIEPCAEV